MSWKDRLQQGRFRGVAFYVTGHDVSGGRKQAQHQFPKRNDDQAEDLGRRKPSFAIEGYVIGEDYMAARDALIDALEQEGPGTLVHPWLGTRRVQVVEYRVRESFSEGGIARFSVRFEEAGERLMPSAAVDTRQAVAARADAARDALIGDFSDRFDVSGPQFVADAATGLLASMTARLDALAGSLPGLDGAAAFQRDLTAFSGSLATLIREPVGLAGSATSLIGALAGLAARPIAALSVYRRLFDFGDDAKPVPATTPSRKRQAGNQQAVIGMVRTGAAIEAAVVATSVDYETADDAMAVRDELADKLDAEMATAPDRTYQALAELRAALARDITERGARLAKIVSVTTPATVPAIVLAHRLYGDALRESEIVLRNRIRHPGFVPGGVRLEVLSDA